MPPRTIHFSDGTRLDLRRNERGELEMWRGRSTCDLTLQGVMPVWLHTHRKCVNGATCECGCGSTKVRVVKRERAEAMSVRAKSENARRARIAAVAKQLAEC